MTDPQGAGDLPFVLLSAGVFIFAVLAVAGALNMTRLTLRWIFGSRRREP